jgi:hypothetical protein
VNPSDRRDQRLLGRAGDRREVAAERHARELGVGERELLVVERHVAVTRGRVGGEAVAADDDRRADRAGDALRQPSVSTPLPSSHCSPPTTTVSPQISSQALGAPAQLHPVSVWQVAEQPSPLALPWSSQVSGASITPSLQTTTLFTVMPTVATAEVAVPSLAVKVKRVGCP